MNAHKVHAGRVVDRDAGSLVRQIEPAGIIGQRLRHEDQSLVRPEYLDLVRREIVDEPASVELLQEAYRSVVLCFHGIMNVSDTIGQEGIQLTDLQLYLAIGVPSVVALIGILVNISYFVVLNNRIGALETKVGSLGEEVAVLKALMDIVLKKLDELEAKIHK